MKGIPIFILFISRERKREKVKKREAYLIGVFFLSLILFFGGGGGGGGCQGTSITQIGFISSKVLPREMQNTKKGIKG